MSDTEQANWHAVFERFDDFAESYLLEANLAGMSVAFTTRAGLLRAATYGYADVAARLPVKPETRFEVGSISKSFTAIALLQEYEAGRLELHAPVTDYLPWFTVKSEFEPITVHHLLTHTGGIPTGSDASPASPYLVAVLRECYASTAPGTAFNYSNAGYQILGLILERITGRRYGDVIRERILAPLGMTQSEPAITHALRPRLAVGYTRLYDDRPAHKAHPLVPATWLEYDKGDGSLVCAATDLASYLRCLLNRGKGLISEASFALLTQRGIEMSETTAYGYGLEVGMLDNEPCFGHGGGMVGYVSEMIGDLGRGLGVVILMNGPGNPERVGAFGLQLLRAALQDKDLPDLPKRPDPTEAENATDYAGTYQSGSKMLSFRADDRLWLQHGGEEIPLAVWGSDTFYTPHAAFSRHPFVFSREADGGPVLELSHGSDWYTNGRYDGPMTFEAPPLWAAYAGHYRTYSPWLSNFQVFLRKGQLWLFGKPLEELGEGFFKPLASPYDRLHFDTIIDGEALRVNFSGADFYRVQTLDD